MSLKDGLKLVFCIVICEGSGLIGSAFTAPSIPGWYANLTKPALNPPSWVFGPVWTLLYLLMGIALFLVWQSPKKNKHRKPALILFAIQLALNAIWSPIFFGAQNTGAAFVVIIMLWVAILITMVSFFKVNRSAAYLLIPYIAWVSFASYLNAGIWILN